MANETIYALFQSVSEAERVIAALQDHGISSEHISIIARRPAEQSETEHVRQDFVRTADTGAETESGAVNYIEQPGAIPTAAVKGTINPTSSVDTVENVSVVANSGITVTTGQDAAAGAAVGTGIGLVAGLIAAAAAITIPGFGLVLAGGALAAAAAATVATTAAGAVAGGITGYLRDMGMPEHAVINATDRLMEGDYLIAITAETTNYDSIKKTLVKYNAVSVDTSADNYKLIDPTSNVPGEPLVFIPADSERALADVDYNDSEIPVNRVS